jgi:hypothetical protein
MSLAIFGPPGYQVSFAASTAAVTEMPRRVSWWIC